MAALPHAFLLDLDDTIVSDSDGADRCWRTVFPAFRERLGGHDPETLLEEIRVYREWFWSDPERNRRGRLELLAARQHVLEVALQRVGIDSPSLAQEMTRAYSLERESRARPFPGAIATVEWLRMQGVKLALLTNGGARLQRLKVLRWGLASLFDCVLIEGEFGAGKPDLQVYRHALAQLRAVPEKTWMVGDNLEWDVGAPQRLGITGIWVDHAKTGVPDSSPVRPDRIIQALTELRALPGDKNPPGYVEDTP